MSITSITYDRDDGGSSNTKKSQKWPEGVCVCCVFPWGWEEGEQGLKGELESSFIRCCHTGEQGRGWGRGP